MDDTLAKIGGYISSKLNSFKQSALQGASQVINAGNHNMGNFYKNFAITPQKVQQTSNYFNPMQSGTQGFWGTPVAKGLGQAQNFVNTTMSNPPSFNFTQPLTSKIQNPVLRTAASIPLGMAESMLNTPSNYMKGIARTGTNIGKLVRGEQVSPQQFLVGAAPTAEALLNVASLNTGGNVVKQLGKQSFLTTVAEGAGSGARYGGAYGLLGGLQAGENIKDPMKYGTMVASNALQGAGAGALIGGTLSGGAYGVQALRGKLQARQYPMADFVEKVQKDIPSFKEPIDLNNLPKIKTVISEFNVEGYLSDRNRPYVEGILQRYSTLSEKQIKNLDKVPVMKELEKIVGASDVFHSKYQMAANEMNLPEKDPFLAGLEKDQQVLPEDIQAMQGKKTSFKTGRGSVYDETGLEIAPPVEKATKAVVRNVQDELTSHQSGGYVAQVNANKTNNDFLQLAKQNNVNPNIEWKLVQYAENPTPETASRLKLTPEDIQRGAPLMEKYRQLDDSVIKRAQEAGIDVNYLQNHIRHFFQEPAAKVQQVMDKMQGKGISGRPGFANERTTPNYIDIGGQLTPKYTTFGQHAAATEFELEKAIQNKQTFQGLYSNGLIKETSASPLGWKLIKSDFFRSPTNGESMSAPPEVAAKLNKYFGDTGLFADNPMARKIAEKAGQISGTWQDVKLTGGVNTVNAYTIGQSIADMTTGLGDILTGHPIRGAKTILNPMQKMVANFDPGYASRFEQNPENATAIKQMAQNNIKYQGTMSFQEMQSNVATGFNWKKVVDKGGDMWNSISNNPTFKKMIFQRNVDQFKILRDSYMGSGMAEEQAVKLAADNLKNAQGIKVQLGQDHDWNNIVKSLFMAPKYREGLITKFGNVVKGMTTQITNPAYQQSRALGVGMLATYAGYNMLQKQLTGKWMWQNPPGKEFELVIPDPNDKTKYTSVPFMPGSTAIFRRGAGTATSLAQGDTSEAGKQFSSMFSMPISQTGQILSNKDYWGNEIRNPNRPRIEGLPGDTMQQQLGIQAVKSVVPGPLEQVIQYGQDTRDYETKKALGKNVQKPTVGKYALRAMEIPIKQGSVPNPYYSAVDEVGKKYDKETVDAYNRLHPKTDPFLAKEVTDIVQRTKNNTDRWANPNIYLMERDIATRTAKDTGKPIDPLYSVPTETALRYFNYERQAPKSQERKDMMAQYPELAKLMQMRSEYFKSNPIPGGSGTNPPPQPSDYVQQQMNAKNWRDPQVQAYLQASTNYANEQRKQLGLPPVAGSGSGGVGGFSTAQKKFFAKKIKYSNRKLSQYKKPKKLSVPRLKSPRIKKLKAMKLPKWLRAA